MFQVGGLKILGSVETHIFLIISFSGRNIILYILKGICLSKCIKLHLSRKSGKIGFNSIFRLGQVTLNAGVFIFNWPDGSWILFSIIFLLYKDVHASILIPYFLAHRIRTSEILP